MSSIEKGAGKSLAEPSWLCFYGALLGFSLEQRFGEQYEYL